MSIQLKAKITEPIFMVTHHQKEKILSPLFAQAGLTLVGIDADTDQFGTFSGEKVRLGSVKDALRAKLDLGLKLYPDSKFLLASEGSFGPHPQIAAVQSNLESLMLLDVERKIEHYCEYLATEVVNYEIEVDRLDPESLAKFILKVQFPQHALMVRPKGALSPIFKGIQSEIELNKAISEVLSIPCLEKAIVQVDLRSHVNLTRRRVILLAGQKLIEQMMCSCPKCSYFGYSIAKGIPGLPCESCRLPSHIAKDVMYECKACQYSEIKPRPDGVIFLDAQYCETCNP